MITPRFRARQGAGDTGGIARTIAVQILELYPLLFLIVGLAVLFLRVEDHNAWLLALLFSTFITAGDMPSEFVAAPLNLRYFLLAYRTVMGSLLTGLFYFFFAVFPTRSPIDRKLPWLKWALLASGVCLGVGGYRHGDSEALPFILAVVANHLFGAYSTPKCPAKCLRLFRSRLWPRSVFHSRPVTSDLAPAQKKADHRQGVSGTGIPLQEASKFFVIKILTSNPLGLKILQGIFAKPAPVKTFREGRGRGVPLAFNVFPKRNCCRTSDRTPQANYFFDTFPPYLIPPQFCATFVLNS